MLDDIQDDILNSFKEQLDNHKTVQFIQKKIYDILWDTLKPFYRFIMFFFVFFTFNFLLYILNVYVIVQNYRTLTIVRDKII